MCQICETFLNLLTDEERRGDPRKSVVLQVVREHPEGVTTEEVVALCTRKLRAIVVFRRTLIERPCEN